MALPSTASLPGRGGFVRRRRQDRRRGDGRVHQAAPYFRIERRATQPVRERKAAEKSRTEAIANRVAFDGGELSWSMFLTIVGASGREGS